MKMNWLIVFCELVALFGCTVALDNGLALTPPMGWLSWERFRCNIDCDNDPDNCISEKLFMTVADRLAADGYRDLGYQYVIIDDCWLATERAADGKLQPDPKRFPSGIKALADYIHSKGLKFGIYEDFGTHTCGGYPGSEYYLQLDAQTFADWTVDYLKLDGCYSDPSQYTDGYPAMTMWLNRTGRPILYSCSWPAYQETGGSAKPDYPRIAKYCNVWRNYDDIQDSWDSVSTIINFYGDDHSQFVEVAGPGNFNDPDMLIIGNFGLSYDQQRVQMALWAIMASPLIMSNDLRKIDDQSKALLQHKLLISINQDKLGKQGRRILKSGSIQVWTRPLQSNRLVFAFLNTGTGGMPTKVSVKLSDLGLTGSAGYNLVEVFESMALGKYMPNTTFSAQVNPTGVFVALATPL